MAEVLFIKTSSLGDVVHHMPALTEARRHLADSQFVWVVEEAFAPLARLHPAANRIVPVASRRWRKAPLSAATWQETRAFLEELRERRYDKVIDTQGLFRTGLIARAARGERHGYDRHSIREPLASWCYDVKHSVGRNLHAVERNRMLTGAALNYRLQGPPDFGLPKPPPAGGDYAVLLHATARADKEWPEQNWIALGRMLSAQGLKLVLPFGSEREQGRSERIAAALGNAQVPPRAPLDRVAQLIGGARAVVGVDTGLLHLAAAYAVPLVAIFTGSFPALTGPVGAGPLRVVGDSGAPPPVGDVAEALKTIGVL